MGGIGGVGNGLAIGGFVGELVTDGFVSAVG